MDENNGHGDGKDALDSFAMNFDAGNGQGMAPMPNGNVNNKLADGADESELEHPEALKGELPEESDLADTASPGDRQTAETGGEEQQIGQALRSAYRTIMDEAIPGEMLDLLNRLD